MNVEVVCTTDDPTDSLNYHQQFASEKETFKMLPAFRPDKAMNCDRVDELNQYIDQLQERTDIDISSFQDYCKAIQSRHDFCSQWLFHIRSWHQPDLCRRLYRTGDRPNICQNQR